MADQSDLFGLRAGEPNRSALCYRNGQALRVISQRKASILLAAEIGFKKRPLFIRAIVRVRAEQAATDTWLRQNDSSSQRAKQKKERAKSKLNAPMN